MVPAEQPGQPSVSGRVHQGPRVWLSRGQRLRPTGPAAGPAGSGRQRGPVEQDGRGIAGFVFRGGRAGEGDRGNHAPFGTDKTRGDQVVPGAQSGTHLPPWSQAVSGHRPRGVHSPATVSGRPPESANSGQQSPAPGCSGTASPAASYTQGTGARAGVTSSTAGQVSSQGSAPSAVAYPVSSPATVRAGGGLAAHGAAPGRDQRAQRSGGRVEGQVSVGLGADGEGVVERLAGRGEAEDQGGRGRCACRAARPGGSGSGPGPDPAWPGRATGPGPARRWPARRPGGR